jgi:hypothetical protein
LPDRFLTESPSDDSTSRLTSSQLAAGVAAYNLARGWTAEGWLGPSTIESLGLTDL